MIKNIFAHLSVLCALLATPMLWGCEVSDGGEITPPQGWHDDCSANAPEVGAPNQFMVQKIPTGAWEFDDDPQFPLLATQKPVQLRLPDDLVGLVVTIDDPHRMPGLYDTLLDRRIVASMYEPQGEKELSKSHHAWEDTFSMGLPSNAKTVLKGRKCLEIHPVSIGDESNVEPEVYITTIRRDNLAQGNLLDIQARVLDGALDAQEIAQLDYLLGQTYSHACQGRSECLRPHFVDNLVSITSVDGSGEVTVGDSGESDLYRQIAALGCDDISNIACEDAERGINIVFVNSLYLHGLSEDLTLLGLAGGIPATPFDGTIGSSLFISVDGHRYQDGSIAYDMLADTIAHELGHTLGLFHTTEQGGESFDPIADTPECDRRTYGTDANDRVGISQCKNVDADNLMFWEGGIQGILTPEQVMVLRSHPLAYREE